MRRDTSGIQKKSSHKSGFSMINMAYENQIDMWFLFCHLHTSANFPLEYHYRLYIFSF